MEESIRMTEDRDKWRKYVHGVANPRIEASNWGAAVMRLLPKQTKIEVTRAASGDEKRDLVRSFGPKGF